MSPPTVIMLCTGMVSSMLGGIDQAPRTEEFSTYIAVQANPAAILLDSNVFVLHRQPNSSWYLFKGKSRGMDYMGVFSIATSEMTYTTSIPELSSKMDVRVICK